ncbi:MAG: hypothetical protein QXP70_03915 [Methanomassiliicoccales archaeon]
MKLLKYYIPLCWKDPGVNVRVDTYLVGIQPRTEELIQATRDWDRERITSDELDEIRLAAADRDFSMQSKFDFTYFSDPMFYWQDILRPFVESLEGLDEGQQLARWFDNNTFYRKPVINAYPSISYRKLLKYYFPRLWERKDKSKVIIPTPYSLFMASENRYFPDKRSGVLSCAQEMERVASMLQEKGAAQIQFVEPFLFFKQPSQQDVELAIDAFNLTVQRLTCEIMLHFPFGNLEGHFGEIIDFNANILGIDFYSTPLSSITDFDTKKGIGVGCIDARNSLIEGVDWLVSFAGRVKEKLGDIKHMAIIPNCDLEFLPRAIAEEKMKVMAEAKRRCASLA